MKTPLNYQITEYDCGPTTMLNAINFLFDRKEIPPIIVKNIMSYCLDSCNDCGELGKGGTSRSAMMYLSSWLNDYSKVYKFPISCEYITGSEASISQGSKILESLQNGGAVVVRLRYECWHYVLLTGIDQDYINLFDPYYRRRPFHNSGIKIILDKPTRMNRKVYRALLNSEGSDYYAMGPEESREAVILFNQSLKITKN